MLSPILFSIVFLSMFLFASRRYLRIRRNILLGKDFKLQGENSQRWRNLLLIAFGQKKMFKNFLPAILHLFIYVAFLFTQIELIEIIVDGFSGAHRVFATALGSIYTVLINFIEILSLLALVATVIFLLRRNVFKVNRFQKPEMKGWPRMDANIILIGEILLIVGIFSMNSADGILQNRGIANYPDTGHLYLSSILGQNLFNQINTESLIYIERSGWWLHILVVFGFLVYLPYSKHLHIVLAFPNTWYSSLEPKGKVDNMSEIEREVRSMLGLTQDTEMEQSDEIPEFGAKDIFDLKWKNILDAYSCTECGRCTAVCPANITGKKLSPRKIMMDVRDRAEEVGRNLDSGKSDFIQTDKKMEGAVLSAINYNDGKSLFDYITPEEIHACTTCNACVEACPVMINPLEIIIEMRRHEILSQSAGPTEWLPMFNSLENMGAVWQMSEPRDSWTKQ